jgi:hypothetical protein
MPTASSGNAINSSTALNDSNANASKNKISSTYPLFASSMYFVGRMFKNVKDYYNEINPATLTGRHLVIR